MVVTVKLFHCPYADHGKSIAICIQLDFYFFGGLTRAVIVYVCFSQKRSFRSPEIQEIDRPLSAEAVSKRKIDRLRPLLR